MKMGGVYVVSSAWVSTSPATHLSLLEPLTTREPIAGSVLETTGKPKKRSVSSLRRQPMLMSMPPCVRKLREQSVSPSVRKPREQSVLNRRRKPGNRNVPVPANKPEIGSVSVMWRIPHFLSVPLNRKNPWFVSVPIPRMHTVALSVPRMKRSPSLCGASHRALDEHTTSKRVKIVEQSEPIERATSLMKTTCNERADRRKRTIHNKCVISEVKTSGRERVKDRDQYTGPEASRELLENRGGCERANTCKKPEQEKRIVGLTSVLSIGSIEA